MSDAGKTDILNTVDRSNQNLLSGSQALNPGVLNNSIGTTPSDVAWNEAKNLESQASDIRQAATDEKGMWKSTAQDQEAKYKVLLDRANSIKQSVLDQSNGALNITPQDAASFESVISQSPNLSDPVKANLINKVNGIANAGGSIKEIDSLQSPFVRASKAAQELSAVAAKTAPTTLLGKAANVVGSPIDSGRAALSGIANSGVANSIEQSPLVSGMGNILQSAGTTGGQQASSLLGDLVGSGALSLGSDQLQSNPNIPNNTTSPVNGIQPSVDPLAGNIFASLDPALGQGAYEQPMALQALTGMYDPALMSQFTPAATAAATRLGQVQTAANALQGLEGKFQAAGGGQGPLMGTLSQIGGKVSGNEAGQYAGQAQNVGTELQAAGVPQAEINNFLPQLTENNSAANAGIQQLINYLMTLGAPAFNNNTAVR